MTRSRIGSRVTRTEDDALLRGTARYVDDLAAEHDTLRAAFVRSPHAHARIRSVDVEHARAQPGVVAVLLAADLSLGRLRAHRALDPRFDRPPLPVDVVRFVGEPVAVVVAESSTQAVDAAEHVADDYEILPVVLDPGAAGADVVFEQTVANPVDVLRGAEHLVHLALVNQRVASAPMEPDGVLALPDPVGDTLVVYASTQRVHQLRDQIAASLDMTREAVRVIAPNVGGGFGGKFEPSAEAVIVAAVARRLGRAVAWAQTRSENLMTMPHGRAQMQEATLALRSDGELVGLWVDIVGDAGAYPMVGALMPSATLAMIAGTYRWRSGVGGRVRTVATNTTPVGAYRGAGRPEASALLERLVDIAAGELGLDPVELRRRNLVAADAFPYRSATGMTYDSGDYRRCLDLAVERVGYDAIRVEQRTRRAAGVTKQLGVGVAMWIDCTPMNRPGEYASVTLSADDTSPEGYTVVVRDGANDQGQAHQTTWAVILSDVLGTDLGATRVPGGDTALVPHGEGTGSARSLQLAGSSVHRAAHAVLEQARDLAAELLEASHDDIEARDDGRLGVRGTRDPSVSWAEIARAAAKRGGLFADSDVEQPGPTFPSGTHAVVVEVDVETGAVELLRFVAVDDCGRVINPVVVEGQQHGGIVQGIAQALYEGIEFDADGQPTTTSFATYLVPSAADVCSIDARTIDLPTPVNPLGAKGIGQAGAIGSTPAVQNAVIDALGHLGVCHIDLPLAPERVWRAIRDARPEA